MKGPFAKTLATLALPLALAACDRETAAPPPSGEEGETRSIFRPEFQVEPIEALQSTASLETRILFPEGSELTEQALAELATVVASPQARAGGPITLAGHSDSGGSDEVNMRASLERAEAVRDWMIANGVGEERITLIAFGEQNPAAPNALPDGTPNEEGRAANRRVEITVGSDAPAQEEREPTLAETLAAQAEEDDTPDSEAAAQ
ncbi:OmpA family protein [Qipengyuania flava]|uniref:OmpA family protein n=1 Tax=Qipengyuania flava TaxID=192812 RepID=UPI001C634591|nr:OmpA family protein [Qipengyuania flava]QYJ07207.1 OmpA family protein [Qipengyuania flava]